MFEAVGKGAPDWVRKRFKGFPEDEPWSTERLVWLAEEQKFLVRGYANSFMSGRSTSRDAFLRAAGLANTKMPISPLSA